MDLQRSPLFEDEWCCVLRRGHPALRRRRKLDAESWAQLGHVVVSPTGGRRGDVDSALEQAGLTRRVALVVPHFSSALAVVAKSDLVCTTFRRLAESQAEVLALSCLPTPLAMQPLTMSLLWHPRTQHDPAQHWLRELIVDALRR